jgi:hypothetical protein
MIVHCEGNLNDLRRHNDMLRYMIRQMDGSDESDETKSAESGPCGWNARLDSVSINTSQELATQASLTLRLAELLGVDV